VPSGRLKGYEYSGKVGLSGALYVPDVRLKGYEFSANVGLKGWDFSVT
jgi:hypothetical protein